MERLDVFDIDKNRKDYSYIEKYHLMKGQQPYTDVYNKFIKLMKNKYKNIFFLEINDYTGAILLPDIAVDNINIGKSTPNVILNNLFLLNKDFIFNDYDVKPDIKTKNRLNDLVNKSYLRGEKKLYFDEINSVIFENSYRIETKYNIKNLMDKNDYLFILYNFKFSNGGGHSIVYIINNKIKILETFNPQGTVLGEDYYLLNLSNIVNKTDDYERYKIKYLEEYSEIKFRHMFLDDDYKIINSSIICPKLNSINVGPQFLSQLVEPLHRPKRLQKLPERGYCFAWSLLFMFYRVKYIDISPTKVIEIIFNKAKETADKTGQDFKFILLEKIKFFITELMKL